MDAKTACIRWPKSFRDFLRLLLALHDAAAIEQAWQWNAAQLEEFEQKHPSSDEQLAALDKIVFTFHLRPMAEPWKYIHTVQSGFDYGKLRFSEEFYDDDDTGYARTSPGRSHLKEASGARTESPERSLQLGEDVFLGGRRVARSGGVCLQGGNCAGYHEARAGREAVFASAKNGTSPGKTTAATGRRHSVSARRRKIPSMKTFGARLTVNGRTLSQSHGCAIVLGPAVSGGKRPGGQACAGAL